MEILTVFEGISALAVVLSLLFVGFQMKDSARATRSAIAAETNASLTAWYDSLTNDRELTKLYRDFIMTPEKLTEDEQFCVIIKMHAYMMIHQNAFYLQEEGTLAKSIQASITGVIGWGANTPGFRLYWSMRSNYFTHPGFIEAVEAGLKAETETSDIYGVTSAKSR